MLGGLLTGCRTFDECVGEMDLPYLKQVAPTENSRIYDNY